MAKETYPASRAPRVKRGEPHVAKVRVGVGEFEDIDTFSEKVRVNAHRWRLISLIGDGRSYDMESNNLEWVVAMAQVLRQAHQRALIEAISVEGRFVPIPEKRWDEFKQQWRARDAVPKQATGEPEGSGVYRVRKRRDTGGA